MAAAERLMLTVGFAKRTPLIDFHRHQLALPKLAGDAQSGYRNSN
jgi:hypothetical protein